MFSKDNEQLESFIGSGTEFQGELNVKGIIRVDGHFDGKMNVGSLILSEMGVIKGEISAKKISIAEGAKVNGKIEMKVDENKVIDFKSKEGEG